MKHFKSSTVRSLEWCDRHNVVAYRVSDGWYWSTSELPVDVMYCEGGPFIDTQGRRYEMVKAAGAVGPFSSRVEALIDAHKCLTEPTEGDSVSIAAELRMGA